MSTSNPTVVARAEQAAEILNIKSEEVLEMLSRIGINNSDMGLRLLDAWTTNEGDLVAMLAHAKEHAKGDPLLKEKAAAAVLKGRDPFVVEEPGVIEDQKSQSGNTVAEAIVKTIQGNRPYEQWKDRELLETYDKDRDMEIEDVLHRRAKCQPFIILKENGTTNPGDEPIDIEESLEMLHAARRGRKNPTIYPVGEVVKNVYKITELNIDDRVTELCPLCGEALYRGYCSSCEIQFKGIDDDARAYLRLIAESDNYVNVKSFSDRKALIASAMEGLDDLRKTWPSVSKMFDELKLTNSLPQLRIIQNLPRSQKADPFYQSGNRSY